MTRGTTPTHVFTFHNIDPSELLVLNIYYAQRGIVMLEKHKSDCTFETISGDVTSYNAKVKLSQAETKLFVPNVDAEIQLRVLTDDRVASASKKFKVQVFDLLDDEELIV